MQIDININMHDLKYKQQLTIKLLCQKFSDRKKSNTMNCNQI